MSDCEIEGLGTLEWYKEIPEITDFKNHKEEPTKLI